MVGLKKQRRLPVSLSGFGRRGNEEWTVRGEGWRSKSEYRPVTGGYAALHGTSPLAPRSGGGRICRGLASTWRCMHASWTSAPPTEPTARLHHHRACILLDIQRYVRHLLLERSRTRAPLPRSLFAGEPNLPSLPREFGPNGLETFVPEDTSLHALTKLYVCMAS